MYPDIQDKVWEGKQLHDIRTAREKLKSPSQTIKFEVYFHNTKQVSSNAIPETSKYNYGLFLFYSIYKLNPMTVKWKMPYSLYRHSKHT